MFAGQNHGVQVGLRSRDDKQPVRLATPPLALVNPTAQPGSMLACSLWEAWPVLSSAKYHTLAIAASMPARQNAPSAHDPHQPPTLIINLTNPKPSPGMVT